MKRRNAYRYGQAIDTAPATKAKCPHVPICYRTLDKAADEVTRRLDERSAGKIKFIPKSLPVNTEYESNPNANAC